MSTSRFSRHALARLAERNISLADVSSVIDDSDVTFADPKSNPCYIREINGRRNQGGGRRRRP